MIIELLLLGGRVHFGHSCMFLLPNQRHRLVVDHLSSGTAAAGFVKNRPNRPIISDSKSSKHHKNMTNTIRNESFWHLQTGGPFVKQILFQRSGVNETSEGSTRLFLVLGVLPGSGLGCWSLKFETTNKLSPKSSKIHEFDSSTVYPTI